MAGSASKCLPPNKLISWYLNSNFPGERPYCSRSSGLISWQFVWQKEPWGGEEVCMINGVFPPGPKDRNHMQSPWTLKNGIYVLASSGPNDHHPSICLMPFQFDSHRCFSSGFLQLSVLEKASVFIFFSWLHKAQLMWRLFVVGPQSLTSLT